METSGLKAKAILADALSSGHTYCSATSVLTVASHSTLAAGASAFRFEFQVGEKQDQSLSSVSPFLKSFSRGNLT